MPLEFSPNVEPRYYARPAAFLASIGAAAITSFPGSVAVVGVQASGTLTSNGTQPANNSTVTVNGTLITFVTTGGFSLADQPAGGPWPSVSGVSMLLAAMGPAGLQVRIGANAQATMNNLLALLRGLPDQNWKSLHFQSVGAGGIKVINGVTGTGGNAVTLAASTSPASSITASGATLSGGLALTAGYACLVEPQGHAVEIQALWGICRASQAAGTITLIMSDATSLWKVDALSYAAGATLSATAELSRIPFSNITAAAPLVVPPLTGLYAYGATTQLVDLYAGPAGAY